MTLVTKTVNGIPYFYLQDSISSDGTSKVVTTFVARVDEQPEKLLAAKLGASMRHIHKLLTEIKAIDKYATTYLDETDSMGLDYVTLMYKQLKHVIQPSELEEIDKTFYIRYVYGTTAIEGITLNESETAKVLQSGLTPANKPISDTVAVANFKDVRAFLESYTGDVTEKLIKEVHSILMYGMKGEDGKPIPRGIYRDRKVLIHGLGYVPPAPELIPQSIKYILLEYEKGKQERVHPLELAAIFHQKFEELHPFQDGNGRTGREILNLMLMRNGYPPIYITPTERTNYINALEAGNSGDYSALVGFIFQRVIATMEFYMSKTSLGPYIFNSPDFEEMMKEFGLDDAKGMMTAFFDEAKQKKELP